MKRLFIATFLTIGLAFQLLAVPISLRNNSMKSIPLKIPGVMNPNLSPYSTSGVDLAVGQKIFFMHKKKKYLLLEITEDMANQKIIVDEVIRERKKELHLR